MISFLRAYKHIIVSSLVFVMLPSFSYTRTRKGAPLTWIRRIVDVGDASFLGSPGAPGLWPSSGDLPNIARLHGGQLALEFVHRGLNLGRLGYTYTRGWYEKPGGQLYVNRGIRTTILPIRLGARPEISVLELSRS